MTNIALPTVSRRLQTLLAVLLTTVIAVLATQASAAHAEKAYSCSGSLYCASANGPEIYQPYNYTFYNRVENQSGKGVCDKVWSYYGGSYHEHAVCTESGSQLTYEPRVGCEKCYAHGEVERWFQQYLYILYGYDE